MPATPLTSNPTLNQTDRLLGPLIQAKVNSHIGNAPYEFAKTLFGDQMAADKLTEVQAEVRAMNTSNGGGTGSEMYACRGLMRAHLVLKNELGEAENAAELRRICVGYYGEETVKQQEEMIAGGW